MKIRIDFTEDDFRMAIQEYAERRFGVDLNTGEWLLTIETKSKQNYKSEWENAAYRGTLENKP